MLAIAGCTANIDGDEVSQTESELTLLATTTCKTKTAPYPYEHKVTVKKIGWGDDGS